jgi:asparaginyl-tRNA synthetase
LRETPNAVSSSEVPKADFSDRVPIRSIVSRLDDSAGLAGNQVRIGGWVKTGRKADKDAFAFLELNNWSCPGNLQVIVDATMADLSPLVPASTCVVVDGVLRLPPAGTKQKVELQGEKVVHVGPVDPTKYSLSKTRLTLEIFWFAARLVVRDREREVTQVRDRRGRREERGERIFFMII